MESSPQLILARLSLASLELKDDVSDLLCTWLVLRVTSGLLHRYEKIIALRHGRLTLGSGVVPDPDRDDALAS